MTKKRGGQNKLSAEEHQRRGTFQPARHAAATLQSQPHVLTREEEAWLENLPPTAVRVGRQMLEDGIVADRAAFREYLWAYAALDALPRTRDTPLEALADANARATHLLGKVRWRWR